MRRRPRTHTYTAAHEHPDGDPRSANPLTNRYPNPHADRHSYAHTSTHRHPNRYRRAHSGGPIVKPFPDSHAGSCARHLGFSPKRHVRGRNICA